MVFSAKLHKWLQLNRPFVNAFGGALQCDPFGGRSLGPASGNIADTYPFLEHSGFSGLFAGLSISGIEPGKPVRLKQYAAKFGFTPVTNGIFSFYFWQNLSSDDWVNIEPSDYTPQLIIAPFHALDLIFLVDGTELSTTTWRYSQLKLSDKYLQHSWISSVGIVIVAVTYLAVPEHQAPFLRPRYVLGDSEIDPHCIYTKTESTRLIIQANPSGASGAMILNGGDNTTVEGNDDTITISKSNGIFLNPYIRKISGASGDSQGNLALLSEGCFKCKSNYDALYPENNTVTLEEAKFCVQNQCTPCCDCEEYVDMYEKLRVLFAEQTKKIEQFNELYQESVELRNQFEEALRDKAHLILVHLYSWKHPQGNTINCDFIISVISKKNTPIQDTNMIFSSTAPGFRITSYESQQSEEISYDIEKTDDLTLRMSDVETTYVGLKQIRLRVKFTADSMASPFNPVEITVKSQHASV
ncbi:hypothetical protein FACS1894214_0190 [Planctomycetales bacterium]|nr:hypothetical protein FACS1894214_0190 [Planctomycetales bacterium]